ncbi:hypothetical protein SDC9_90637 [bioreactor metagenome]|uniref:Uncharacterized protein n=1 Tax=bioreactor metagenome TaxID=1076179 RepID=A0A644ZSH9_9ZZZZ
MAHLRQHQPIGQREPAPQQRIGSQPVPAGPLGRQAGGERPVEDPPLRRRRRLLPHRAEHPFVHHRDHHHQRGAGQRHHRREGTGVGDVRVGRPGGQHAEGPGPLQGVGQREEAQAAVLRPEVEGVLHHGDLGQERPVGEHHALGRAGGAGGVDDRGEVLGAYGRAAPPDLDVRLGGGLLGEVLVVHHHHPVQVGQIVADLGDPVGLQERPAEHPARPGPGQDGPGLRGRGGLVDRHHDRADRLHGDIEDGPHR